MPWCPHCQALEPIWDELAKQVDGPQITFSRVNCVEERTLCASSEIRGYPTINTYRSGYFVRCILSSCGFVTFNLRRTFVKWILINIIILVSYGDLFVPVTNTKIVSRSFCMASPTVWISLPYHLHATNLSRQQFKMGWKPYFLLSLNSKFSAETINLQSARTSLETTKCLLCDLKIHCCNIYIWQCYFNVFFVSD